MSRITHCTSCLTKVFSSATHCHQCGDELRLPRRRLLSRGAWAFIIVVVGIFAISDSIFLLNERRNAYRRDGEGMKSAQGFVKAFLDGDERQIDKRRVFGRALGKRIDRELERVARFVPVEQTERLTIRPVDTPDVHPHAWSQGRECNEPSRRYQFTALVKKQCCYYEIVGQLCVDGRTGAGDVRCFSVDEVNELSDANVVASIGTGVITPDTVRPVLLESSPGIPGHAPFAVRLYQNR